MGVTTNERRCFVVAFFLRPRSGDRFTSGTDKACSAALPAKANDPRGRRFLRCQFAHDPKNGAVSTGLPHLRLNRRVIRYDLGELIGVAPEAGRFFDIATYKGNRRVTFRRTFKLDKRYRFFRNVCGITCTCRSKNSD